MVRDHRADVFAACEYALEIQDPYLAQVVLRVEAGETTIDHVQLLTSANARRPFAFLAKMQRDAQIRNTHGRMNDFFWLSLDEIYLKQAGPRQKHA